MKVNARPGAGSLFAAISGSGTFEVVAAAPGKKIRVTNYVVVIDGAAGSTVTFKSATNAITGAMPFAQYGGVAAPGGSDTVWLETVAGEALNVTVSAGNARGHLSYFLEG